MINIDQDTSVKYFRSTQLNAPVITDNGSILAMLDACLVTGFNTQTVIESVVNGDEITFTTAQAHGFESHDVIAISGADQVALNGEYRIKRDDNMRFTIKTRTPITAATGPITAKFAPAGWSRELNDATGRVYKLGDTALSRTAFLSCKSASTAGYIEVIGYRDSFESVDRGNNPFPTTKSFWRVPAGGTYMIIANSRFIYFLPVIWTHTSYLKYSALYIFGAPHGFGTQRFILRSDSYARSDIGSSYYGGFDHSIFPLMRQDTDYTEFGTDVSVAFKSTIFGTTQYFGRGYEFPSYVHQGMILFDVFVAETKGFSGRMPGLFQTVDDYPYLGSNAAKSYHIEDRFEVSGKPRRLLFNHIYTGVSCIDITGPWL